MKQLNTLFIVMLCVTLSACGYRLAGKADLDVIFEKTYVTHQAGGRLIAELIEKQFIANEYQVVPLEEATAIVEVQYESLDREILSLDEDGKVREYELILRVAYQVKDAQGTVLIRGQEIRLSRDFLFEINELLGKTSEEQQIYQEMRADASRLILYRLQAITTEDIDAGKREAERLENERLEKERQEAQNRALETNRAEGNE